MYAVWAQSARWFRRWSSSDGLTDRRTDILFYIYIRSLCYDWNEKGKTQNIGEQQCIKYYYLDEQYLKSERNANTDYNRTLTVTTLC